jgi:hypothetical protein
MDNDQINYLRHRLERYEKSIQETDEHFDQLECFGRYRACSPFFEKSGISLLIDALKSECDECDIFWQEFDRINEELTSFETRKGHVYRDLLYADLKSYVAAYHSALCCADISLLSIERDHDQFKREEIRVLLAELQKDHDTREIEIFVTSLDRQFLQMAEPAKGSSSKKSLAPGCADRMSSIVRDDHSLIGGENEQARRA